MADFTVTLRGVEELKRRIGAAGIERVLRPAMRNAGVRVETRAKRTVHSPKNPFIGKAGYSVATGRLRSSIGTSPVTGSGVALEVRVGTPYGKGGEAGGTFARSSATPTGRGRFRNRTGGRRNTGDVAVYGPIEERRHPFLVPSLEAEQDAITRVIQAAIDRALGGGR